MNCMKLIWIHRNNNNKKNFIAPFLWMGFNCLKAAEPLWDGSLLFITKFPEILGTQLINLGRMKDESTLESPSGFQYKIPGLGIQHLNH